MVLSRLRFHGHSLLLFSYLCKIKQKNFSCSVCGQSDIICSIQFTSFWIVPHLSLSGTPSLAIFLPFLTSSLDHRVWPYCWVSVEFLRAPMPWKGSGSTTTILQRTAEYFLLRKTSNTRILDINSSSMKSELQWKQI